LLKEADEFVERVSTVMISQTGIYAIFCRDTFKQINCFVRIINSIIITVKNISGQTHNIRFQIIYTLYYTLKTFFRIHGS